MNEILDKILVLKNDGVSDGEIEDQLVEEYGQQVIDSLIK